MGEYLHYRIFNDKGALNVKDQFDTTDPTLGRILLNQITPPRTVSNLKRTISTREGIPETTATSLFLSLNEGAVRDETIGFFSERGFGINLEDPIGVVFQGVSDPRSVDLTGQWSLHETYKDGKVWVGAFCITMQSSTAFEGLGYEGNILTPTEVRPFNITGGKVVGPNQFQWVGVHANGNRHSWSVAVTLSADGKTMVRTGNGNVVLSAYRRL